MNNPPPSQSPIKTNLAFESEWPVRLIGGTVSGKFKRYLRVIGLGMLGGFLSVVIGVIVGLLFSNGDAGILTATGLFVVSVLAALAYGRRQVVKHAVVLLDRESFVIGSETRAVVDWPYQEIRKVQCEFIGQGIGLKAVLPSGMDKVSIEGKRATVVFEMEHENALECVEIMKTITTNTVYTGAMIEAHVPSTSNRPDQVWRTKLQAELRSACSQIAFGLFGSAFLCLFIYGIWTGQRPQGPLGLFVLTIIGAIFGPFLLFIGVRHLIEWFFRRRRFVKLSKEDRFTEISDLISEIYDEPKS